MSLNCSWNLPGQLSVLDVQWRKHPLESPSYKTIRKSFMLADNFDAIWFKSGDKIQCEPTHPCSWSTRSQTPLFPVWSVNSLHLIHLSPAEDSKCRKYLKKDHNTVFKVKTKTNIVLKVPLALLQKVWTCFPCQWKNSGSFCSQKQK